MGNKSKKILKTEGLSRTFNKKSGSEPLSFKKHFNFTLILFSCLKAAFTVNRLRRLSSVHSASHPHASNLHSWTRGPEHGSLAFGQINSFPLFCVRIRIWASKSWLLVLRSQNTHQRLVFTSWFYLFWKPAHVFTTACPSEVGRYIGSKIKYTFQQKEFTNTCPPPTVS